MHRFLPLILVLGCPPAPEEPVAEPVSDAPDAPVTETGSFATATSGELGLMVLAGYGGDVFFASNAYTASHADAAEDRCPQVIPTDDGYELSTEGCVASASGREWSGRLVVHNPVELPEDEGLDYAYDATVSTVAEFVGLSVALDGERVVWEGTLEITPMRRGTLIDSAMTTTSGGDRPLTAFTTFGCGLPDDPHWCGPIGDENLIFLGDDLEIVPSMDAENYGIIRFAASSEVLSVDFTSLDFETGCVVGTLATGESLTACMPDEEIVDVDPVVSSTTDEAP